MLTEARTENGASETKTYSYDPNGNLLTVSSGGTVLESYTYDAFGKMVSYSKSGETTSYTYRPDGLLYTKQTGSDASTKKYYVFSDGQMVYEQTGSDNIGATVYTYGLTRISAKFRTSLTDEQSIRYYYLYNAHGDVVRIISGTNVTVKTYDYDAFGNDRNELTADANPFRYCGEYFDTATQTYFLRARWYDPATGRFTQQDSWVYYKPDDPLSLNLYLYCYGNPVGYVDPSGRFPISLALGLLLGTLLVGSLTSCSNNGHSSLRVVQTPPEIDPYMSVYEYFNVTEADFQRDFRDFDKQFTDDAMIAKYLIDIYAKHESNPTIEHGVLILKYPAGDPRGSGYIIRHFEGEDVWNGDAIDITSFRKYDAQGYEFVAFLHTHTVNEAKDHVFSEPDVENASPYTNCYVVDPKGLVFYLPKGSVPEAIFSEEANTPLCKVSISKYKY